ncbi:MAG: hypothetical protein JSS30_02080 [Verrucomicrobia bacterium]|nr:hypothetical protein [Verrucomicrobiota bacterium]
MSSQIKDAVGDPFVVSSVQKQAEDPPELTQTANKVAKLPTVVEVAVDYFQTPEGLRELVVEPAVYALRWTEIAVTALGEIVKGPQKIFESAAHLLLWAELPAQILKLGKSVVKFCECLGNKAFVLAADKAAKVYVNATFLTGLVADAVTLLYHENVIALSSAALTALQVLGFLGGFALFINAARGIKKEIGKLMESEPWTPKFNLSLIRLVSKVVMAVAAIFTMVAFFVTCAYLSWLVLMFSSVLLLLTVVAYFYEKTHFPDKANGQISGQSQVK